MEGSIFSPHYLDVMVSAVGVHLSSFAVWQLLGFLLDRFASRGWSARCLPPNVLRVWYGELAGLSPLQLTQLNGLVQLAVSLLLRPEYHSVEDYFLGWGGGGILERRWLKVSWLCPFRLRSGGLVLLGIHFGWGLSGFPHCCRLLGLGVWLPVGTSGFSVARRWPGWSRWRPLRLRGDVLAVGLMLIGWICLHLLLSWLILWQRFQAHGQSSLFSSSSSWIISLISSGFSF